MVDLRMGITGNHSSIRSLLERRLTPFQLLMPCFIVSNTRLCSVLDFHATICTVILTRCSLTIQIAEKLLSGEGGQERLRRLCYLLDARRRRMLAEIVSFYPLVSLKQPITSSTKG